jgi:hypothetical protein
MMPLLSLVAMIRALPSWICPSISLMDLHI